MKPATIGIGNRRLLKLAAFLRTVPRHRFEYASFVGYDWKGASDLSCGTTACALGWATTMPEFRRLGLRLGKVDHFPKLLGSRFDPWEVAVRLFGLEREEAVQLFSPDLAEYNATPSYVARKIEQFVKARQEA